MLTALSALASEQAEPTEATIKKCLQFLDYAASQDKAVVTYKASDMKLAIHSDASYLSEPKAHSRAGGHFFLTEKNNDTEPNNGAILNIAQIIKAVMSSAAEAELGALFINAKLAIPIRHTLEELGHPQGRTPMQTDNSTAHGIVNNKIQPKATKESNGYEILLAKRSGSTKFLPVLLATWKMQHGRLLDKTSCSNSS
jgi:hypothetical protein